VTKYLWIPVLGTVAAIVAVALAHGPREEEDAASTLRGLVDRLPPAPPEHILVLAADGTLSGEGRTFASAAEVVAELAAEAGPRPVITLRKASDEVTDEALEAAAAALEGSFDVRTGPEAGG
jgi:hypothetical protein